MSGLSAQTRRLWPHILVWFSHVHVLDRPSPARSACRKQFCALAANRFSRWLCRLDIWYESYLTDLTARRVWSIHRELTGSSLSVTRLSRIVAQRNSRSRAYANASSSVSKRAGSLSHSPESSGRPRKAALATRPCVRWLAIPWDAPRQSQQDIPGVKPARCPASNFPPPFCLWSRRPRLLRRNDAVGSTGDVRGNAGNETGSSSGSGHDARCNHPAGQAQPALPIKWTVAASQRLEDLLAKAENKKPASG